MPEDTKEVLLKTEEVQEGDEVPRKTFFSGEFFPDIKDGGALCGRAKDYPAETEVQIYLRVNGRLLLRTNDGFLRWADKAFLIPLGKKK